MSKKHLDKETEKIFTRGDKLKSLVENSGWAVAREMLIRKVAQQLNISDIGTLNPDPASVVLLIGIRQETAKALLAWLAEIEGTVQQHKANLGSFTEVPDAYIINMEELENRK